MYILKRVVSILLSPLFDPIRFRSVLFFFTCFRSMLIPPPIHRLGYFLILHYRSLPLQTFIRSKTHRLSLKASTYKKNQEGKHTFIKSLLTLMDQASPGSFTPLMFVTSPSSCTTSILQSASGFLTNAIYRRLAFIWNFPEQSKTPSLISLELMRPN